MCNEVASFLQFIHSLLQPVLRGNDVLETGPLLDDDRREMSEVSEAQRSLFSPSSQEAFRAACCRPSAPSRTFCGSFCSQSGPSPSSRVSRIRLRSSFSKQWRTA